MYDGTSLIKYGVEIGKPFIFVVANYRVNGFGFLPGKEVLEDQASNLGLLDQRMALEWVADNIEYFGGDPDKVSIWGESAGAWSVFNQMGLYGGGLQYNSKHLFRGAIMASGGILPAQSVDSPKAQAVYDRVVNRAGCEGAADTLNCLRGVDYTTFLNAVSSAPGMLSYTALGLDYIPRFDGHTLPDSPEVLASDGRYVPVPVISGTLEDEGTLFALFQSNLTETEHLVQYLKQYYYSEATDEDLTGLVETYGKGLEAITENSPYRTGLLNEIFPGFKKRASVIGDIFFTLTRRLFLTSAHESKPDLPSWSYFGSWNHGTPILGTFHGGDILQVFFGIKDNYAARSIRQYFLNFVYHLDPNGDGTEASAYPFWPDWRGQGEMMQFSHDKSWISLDNFRLDSFDYFQKHGEALRL
jgi:carboxylesterase type B